MNCERIQEYLSKAADGEALEWEREAIGAHLPGCADCAEFQAAIAPAGTAMRARVARAVELADFDAIWAGIEKGLDARPAAARAPRVETERGFGRLFLGRFAAVAATVLILLTALAAPAIHTAGVADNKIDVNSIDAGKTDTVTVFTTPDDDVTVIWVDEDARS